MYPALSIPAPRRLAIFRAKNANWRAARYSKLSDKYSDNLCAGSNDKTPVWCSMSGEQFRNERDAHDVISLGHSGWFTDGEMQDETAIGIVAGLPHGRFLAGYRLTMNDQRVYFGEVFDDEKDAARMADKHARVIGESESAYQERWQKARDIEDRISERMDELVVLRQQHSYFADVPKLAPQRAEFRRQTADLIEHVRCLRRELATYSDVL